MQTSDAQMSGPPIGGIVLDIALNAIIPVVLYKLSKRYLSQSELTGRRMEVLLPGSSLMCSRKRAN